MCHRNKAFIYLSFIFLVFLFLVSGCKISEPEETYQDPTDFLDTSQWDPDPVYETNNLTVGWIERLPEMDYVWGSDRPDVEGWPDVGQVVTWRAHVKNWSSSRKSAVNFQWRLDDEVVDSGTLNIPGNGYVTTDFSWNWTFERHSLDFVLEPEKGYHNHLEIATNAISLGLYVEQSVYDYFHEHQHKLNIGSNSFEGWAQRQIRVWNHMFQTAVYPETPEGVLDRVRIDCITVAADGSLPLVDNPEPDFDPKQATPNLNDRTVDLQWGFPVDVIAGYTNHRGLDTDNQFFYSGFMQHELGHARYLVDVYGFEVYHDTRGDRIDIMENGELVAGSAYMAGVPVNNEGLKMHETEDQGVMNGDWTYMGRYTAVCMNLIAGHRATRGNYNEPENIGIFLNDLPAENRLTLTDQEGNLLDNARVSIYQSSLLANSNDGVYNKYFDNIPDLEFSTDANGQVLVGRCPFSNDGIIVHEWRNFSNVAFIIRVEHNSKVGYEIIDISLFNLEYWRGNTALGDYTIAVNLID